MIIKNFKYKHTLQLATKSILHKVFGKNRRAINKQNPGS